MRKSLGIDLGRSPVIGILMDETGRMLERQEIDLEPEVPFEHAVEQVKKLIDKLFHPDVCGIGIGTPGWLDSNRGICRFSPNYPGWKEVDVVTPFREEFKLPVFIINDVNAGALGEKYYGAARKKITPKEGPIFLESSPEELIYSSMAKPVENVTNMVFITVGVGIGGGIIIDDKLVVGANEGAGEIGHIALEPDGPPCSCGSYGCFESLCSLSAVRRGVVEGLKRNWPTKIIDHVSTPEDVTFNVLASCAKENDELTMKILSIVGRYMGMGLAMIANFIDPQVIVIGGEIVVVLDALQPYIVKELKERVRMIPYRCVRFVKAHLEELSGAYGAGTLVFKNLFNF